jgi:hypothetical protein
MMNTEWTDSDVDEILNSYLETALWSTPDMDATEDDDDYDRCLDKNYSITDFDEESAQKSRKDIESFLDKAKLLTHDAMYELGMEVGRIGHDFWLTRNGHGAGFWDGDYDQRKGDIRLGDYLTGIAKEFKILDIEPYDGVLTIR